MDVDVRPLSFLLGGTLVPDLALPFVIKARTGHWPTLALILLAASLACSAASVLLDPESTDEHSNY